MAVETKAETYEYDDLNRVTKVIYDDQSYTIYEYDANGNIKSQSYHEKDESGDSGGGSTGGSNSPGGGGSTGGTTGTGEGDQGNTDTSDQENPNKQHKNGMKAKSGNATYVITSVKHKTASIFSWWRLGGSSLSGVWKYHAFGTCNDRIIPSHWKKGRSRTSTFMRSQRNYNMFY